MVLGLIFNIACLIFITLTAIIYFYKKNVNNLDNKIYRILLIINLVALLVDVVGFLVFQKFGTDSIICIIISRINSICYLSYVYCLLNYVCGISIKNVESKLKKALFIYILLSIGIMALPLHIVMDDGAAYTYGLGADISYACAYAFVGLTILLIIVFRKSIQKKKIIPILAFIIFMSVAGLVQYFYPSVTLMLTVFSIVTFIMFHTIENPDIRMIEQLEVAREQADKANRAKTDFLSSMSHEIRTPLNAIVGFSDCIMDANSLGEAKENANDIVNASQTLLEIVNGILDISKIEAGKLEIINNDYDAPETFLELAKLITPKMNEKGLDFTYNIAPDLPKTLYGDHANIKKIVTNLLSNASKYTDKGFVHYEVSCINTKDVCKLIISVEDSGRGIKKESVDKMFTKFQRLDEDRNTTIEGTGLGLAITKQLIELMGGKIIVHTVFGQGSKFTVVVNQRIEKANPKEQKHLSTTLDLHDVRILLVDDTALNLKVATKLLEKFNANQIATCESGFECLEKIQRGEVYDIILLDDMMPKMSGVITLQKLKEIPGFNIPTVALTANAITGMREKYLADGFDDYLAKPIDKNQLIQVVNGILGRSITEEIRIPEEKITEIEETPNVRDDVITVEDKAEKDKIIPVEDNIEEMINTELDQSRLESATLNEQEIKVDHIEEVEMLEEESKVEDISTIDVVPLVDIEDIPNGESPASDIVQTETTEKVDRSYLESNAVDVDHALELLGDMDMYNMTINDFMAEVEDKWNKINEYKNSNDMENYAIEVHSLKSDCKYLGFMTLADIAYEHELKSKENDSVFVNENFARLEEEYNKVLEIAKTYVDANPTSE